MIARDLAPTLRRAASQTPVVTLRGPRQSGKTTLCRALFPDHAYRTLDAPDVRAAAQDDPRGFLAQLSHGAIIDEVQRLPDLLSYLQGIVDEDPEPGRWILTASWDARWLDAGTQSLAGRTDPRELLPLSWGEVECFANPPATLEDALFSGGYPRIFDQALDPSAWLRSHVGAYLERDVRSILNVRDLGAFHRFLQLCAGRTAELVNASALANACGISEPTVWRWLDVLEASYITFRLPSLHPLGRKRLVKAPRLFFYDTGLVCWLLGIREVGQLHFHPLRGAIFQTWVVSESMKNWAHASALGGLPGQLVHYRDQNGQEIDLIVDGPTTRTLVQVRSSATAPPGAFHVARKVRDELPPPVAAVPSPGGPASGRDATRLLVVYGGDEYRATYDGELLPWRMVRSVTDGAGEAEVGVDSGVCLATDAATTSTPLPAPP